MTNLTPTERRRLRESIEGDDPMLLAEAEAAMAAAQAEIDTTPRRYLAAGFRKVRSAPHSGWRMRFADANAEHPYATVENAANVTLEADDDVWVNSWGRIDAFRHGGHLYVIAYS